MLHTNLIIINLPLVCWNLGCCSAIFIQSSLYPETIFIMARFTRSSRSTGLVLAVALTLGLGAIVPSSVTAQSTSLGSQLESAFRPPRSDSPAPENREGGATRSPCVNGDKPLVALVPFSGVGNTSAEYPTIFWYMPELSAEEAPSPMIEFILRDANEQEVYSAKYPLTKTAQGIVGSPGLMSLNVANLYPLQTNREYRWEITLMCDSQGPDRSQDTFVKGAIKRVKPDPALALLIQRATPQERVAIYAREELWYDTLGTLVELRRARPTDPTLADAWAKLFDSVDLNIISREPLFQGVRSLTTNNR
jgi:hypothetical protein